MHEIGFMPYQFQKHLETSGPFAGLWVRTAKALSKAGYANRDEVRADIESGALYPFLSISDYGKYADREVRAWLSLPSWQDQWGKRVRAGRPVSVSANVTLRS